MRGAGWSPPPARDADFVQSLARGLAVICAFGPGRQQLRLADVARATGMTRSVARRFLLTLSALGYVHSDGAMFSLRPRVLELGYGAMSGLGLPDVAAPHAEQLAARLQESCSVCVLDGQDVVYVLRVQSRRMMTAAIPVGSRLPAYATATGRVLLAALGDDELDRYLARVTTRRLTARTVTSPAQLRGEIARARRQGHAVVDQELEYGLRAVAAPIRRRGPIAAAAMSVSAHASRISLPTLRSEFLPALLDAAAQVEADLTAVDSGSA